MRSKQKSFRKSKAPSQQISINSSDYGIDKSPHAKPARNASIAKEPDKKYSKEFPKYTPSKSGEMKTTELGNANSTYSATQNNAIKNAGGSKTHPASKGYIEITKSKMQGWESSMSKIEVVEYNISKEFKKLSLSRTFEPETDDAKQSTSQQGRIIKDEDVSKKSSFFSVISDLKSKSTTATSTYAADENLSAHGSHNNTRPSKETIMTEVSFTVEGNGETSAAKAPPGGTARKLSVIKEEDSEQNLVVIERRNSERQVPEVSTYNLIELESHPSIDLTDVLQDVVIEEEEKSACPCKKCHSQGRMTNYTTTSSFKHSLVSQYTVDDEDADSYLQEYSSEISVGDGSELFMLMISKITPTKKLLDIYNGYDRPFEEFSLKWNFLKYPDKLFFVEMDDREFIFKYQRMYIFKITPDVYLYLKKCALPFELYVKCQKDKFKLIGRAELRLNDALKHPNKSFTATVEINNKLLKVCGLSSPSWIYGEMDCTFSFMGDLARYEASKFIPTIITKVPPKGDGTYMNILKKPQPAYAKYHNDNLDELELKAFQTGLNLTLIRNAALKVSPEDISTELKERVDWMHQELLWKLTLQENAILAGIDPATVRWRQWKDEYISHVKFRAKGNELFKLTQKADFMITIVELQINPMSRIVGDESIIQLYVEYSFLHYSGVFLETPCMPKPDTDFLITYDFRKTFLIDRKDKSAKILAEMVRNNESITFTVVSEPLENPNTCQTCVDLGSCQLNMFDLVQNDGDVLSKYFTINDNWDDEAEIGKLKIDVSGIYSMRSIALRILTPETFNICR